MKIRVCSLFAGMGGMCKAAFEAGAKIVFANEIDRFACQTYRYNYYHEIVEKDIRAIVDKG